MVLQHLSGELTTPSAGEQIVARCRALAAVSEERGQLTRRFATPAMTHANALVGGWMAVEGAGRRTDGLLATVGQLHALPGAPNVVPGAAVASLDVRHADDGVRAAAVAGLRDAAQEIAERRGVTLDWQPRLENPAVAVDPALTAALTAAVRARGLPEVTLPSGAGHDAVALSELCPIAMLFVRCADGLSHHPDESVSAQDAEVALDVLCDVVLALGARA